MSNEERIDLLLVDHLLTDEEEDWDADESKELSPGSKENDPNADNKKQEKVKIFFSYMRVQTFDE